MNVYSVPETVPISRKTLHFHCDNVFVCKQIYIYLRLKIYIHTNNRIK